MAKFCQNCGNEVNENQEICLKCGSKLNNVKTASVESNKAYCGNCGTELNTNQEICLKCGVRVNNASSSKSGKSKVAAGLFGIFFGCFGVHNFYLGYTGKAIAQLLITLLSCFLLSFVSAIWGLIEGILILAGNTKDANGNDLYE